MQHDDISPIAFANIMIRTAYLGRVTDFTHIKLQKCLYYAYATYNFLYDKIPFDVDKIQFWQYGPVIEEIYPYISSFGKSNLLDTKFKTIEDIIIKEAKDSKMTYTESKIDDERLENNTKRACYYISSVLRSIPPWNLVELTHAETSAWYYYKNTSDGNSNKSKELKLKKIMHEFKESPRFKEDLNY